MLQAPFNENITDFRLRINNNLESSFGDDEETATSLHSIAQSYLMEGNLLQAEIYFEKSAELYRKTSDKFSTAFCLAQYALILRHLTRIEESERLLLEVVKLIENLELKRKDIKNWFFKPYFYALLEVLKEPIEAKRLRKKLEQEWFSNK